MTRIIVTDGHTRTALAAVRSLGRAGYDVVVTGPALRTLAGSSRYVSHAVVLPRSQDDPRQFVRELGLLAQSTKADLILPVTDASMSAVLRNPRELPESVRAIGPSREAYEALSDKGGLLARASAVGLSVPRTVQATTPAELAAAGDVVGFPCVLKPHRSVVTDGGAMREVAVSYAEDAEALQAAGKRYPPGAYPVLVQERILGPGEGVFLLVDQGNILCAFAHRRIREYPVSGGASTYRESVAVDPELRDGCGRLLGSVNWSGAAMLEFKCDRETGRRYLMEVNGRLWGSLKLAIDSGVDFPVLLARLSMGERVAPVVSYRTGLRCRWFWGDVNHLIDRMLHSKTSLDLPADAPSKARALLEFAIWHPGRDRFEIFAWTDPAPWIYESQRWISERFGRLVKKLGRRMSRLPRQA